MGQGSQTGLAMILAEELEADWSKVRLGPVPENAAGWSRRMSTGGSTAVRTSWDPLRKAGATARAMLITAAAEAWKVDRTTCRAQNGAVVHEPSGRRLPYGKLATRAARLAVPTDAPLKDPKNFRLLGRRVPRLDTPSKVDGSATFGIDVTVPGMLVASIERCPVLGGRVRAFDAAAAKAVPGVRHVVQVSSGVAVVADSFWAALNGRKALTITWDEGPLAEVSSAQILRDYEALGARPGRVVRKDGDAEAVLTAAHGKTLEATYQVPFLEHACMEPMNATA